MSRSVFAICSTLLLLFLAPSAQADDKPPAYFPDKVFSETAELDQMTRDWYSRQLSALEEPSLYPAQPDLEAYRLTWLRSFDKPMVFKLVVLSDGTGKLLVKSASGRGGYEPGTVDLRKDVILSKDQVDELRLGLNKTGFWTKAAKVEMMGLDGAQWIFEANSKGLYKLVERFSQDDIELQRWGISLMDLSSVEVGEIY
jgi:hypothetical protein